MLTVIYMILVEIYRSTLPGVTLVRMVPTPFVEDIATTTTTTVQQVTLAATMALSSATKVSVSLCTSSKILRVLNVRAKFYN